MYQDTSTSTKPRSYHSTSSSSTTIEKASMLKCKKKRKQVRFSETSFMLCYDKESPQTDLHYSQEDYDRFKLDALKTVHNVRNSIKATTRSQDSLVSSSDTRSTKDNETHLELYKKSWTRLPRLLKDHAIDQDEVIGIEHLVIDRKIAMISLALRNSYAMTLFEEQHRQVEELGCYDSRMLAYTVEPISKLSSLIANTRANHVATLNEAAIDMILCRLLSY